MKKLTVFFAAMLTLCSALWYMKAATAQDNAAPAAADIPAAPAAPVNDGTGAAAPMPAAPAATAVTVSQPEALPAADAPVDNLDVAKKDVDIPGATATKSSTNDALISITLDDVEMVDVVRMFTKISGANILSTPTNLKGRVTVNLNDVEWKPALESILDMHNLALKEKIAGTGVYSIVPKLPGADPLIVETVFLRYAKVGSVQPVLSAMLMPGGAISPFTSKNAFIIRTTQANLAEIKQIVEKIDKLRDQVFIEAKFMELNDSAIRDLGVNWQVLQGYSASIGNLNWSQNQQRNWNTTDTKSMSQWDKRQNNDQVNQRYDINGQPYQEETVTYLENPVTGGYDEQHTVTPTRTITDTIDKGKNVQSDLSDTFTKTVTDIRTAVLGIDEFRLVLSALKQLNGVTVVSNPKIIVANEESAVIHIGQTEKPFIATVTPATQTTAPFTTYTPGTAVDLGVKLTVTPTVNTASNITVSIAPELTRFVRYDVAPDGATKYPVLATKIIKTLFCLESGKTVAIGGLTETRDQEVETKVPLLGDIPIIGKYLFTHSHTEKSQQETIIFVTVGLALPETIQKSDGYPEDTELARREILRSEVKKQQVEAESAEMQKAILENDSKVKARLLKRRS